MSSKLGFIDSTSYTNLITFDDIVRINQSDDSRIQMDRGGYGDLTSLRLPNKATIGMEMDFLSQSDLANLRAVLYNRKYPHKVLMLEPANSTQQINYLGITNPSSTHICKILDTNDPNPAFGSAAEITTGDYGKLAVIDDNFIFESTEISGLDYNFIFFQFDLGAYYAAGYSANDLQRLTLLLHGLDIYDGSLNQYGYIVEAYNSTDAEWLEVKRQTVTTTSVGVTDRNQQFAGLRPNVESFTNFSDFVDGSDKVTFRVRNLQTNDCTMTIYFVELLVNGYGCIWSDSDKFSWREPYTGAGYTATVELSEL